MGGLQHSEGDCKELKGRSGLRDIGENAPIFGSKASRAMDPWNSPPPYLSERGSAMTQP